MNKYTSKLLQIDFLGFYKHGQNMYLFQGGLGRSFKNLGLTKPDTMTYNVILCKVNTELKFLDGIVEILKSH